jgi:hypothetical protein
VVVVMEVSIDCGSSRYGRVGLRFGGPGPKYGVVAIESSGGIVEGLLSWRS